LDFSLDYTRRAEAVMGVFIESGVSYHFFSSLVLRAWRIWVRSAFLAMRFLSWVVLPVSLFSMPGSFSPTISSIRLVIRSWRVAILDTHSHISISLRYEEYLNILTSKHFTHLQSLSCCMVILPFVALVCQSLYDEGRRVSCVKYYASRILCLVCFLGSSRSHPVAT
jgi:hypothetical protein